MDFLTAKQIAEQWNVSVRIVQKYCKEGRIEDVKKYGSCWMIPSNAKKPSDPRSSNKLCTKIPKYIFLTSVQLPLDKPDKVVTAISEKYRELALADNEFRRGNSAPTKKLWLKTQNSDENKLSVASLATGVAISSGDYKLYYEIENFINSCINSCTDKKQKALLSLPLVLSVVSMAAPTITPKWLVECDFSMFDAELTPFLLYLYAMHLRNIGDYKGVFYTSQSALQLCANSNSFTWLDLSFRLLCAFGAYSIGHLDYAKRYLLEALNIGMPCGFIAPFADYLGKFGGLLGQYIEQYYPQYSQPIVKLWNSSFKNWIKFHNEFTRENISTVLTVQEYQIAHLIANGATYKDTSLKMNLSTGRVKNIILNIYSKLCINKKEQLKDFIF